MAGSDGSDVAVPTRYEVSDMGRVRSLYTRKFRDSSGRVHTRNFRYILKPFMSVNGYLQVSAWA